MNEKDTPKDEAEEELEDLTPEDDVTGGRRLAEGATLTENPSLDAQKKEFDDLS